MSNNELSAKAIDKIADMARATSARMAGLPNGKTGVIVPEGYRLHEMSERHPVPTDLIETRGFVEAESFCRYVNRFKSDATQIFASVDRHKMKAILDYHKAPNEPDKCLHQADLTIKLSDQWEAWTKINGKFMLQQSFAEFIEENSVDIIEPDGATLLEMVSHLKAHKNVEFESGKNLQNGETQFIYREEIKGTARKGEITIPDHITLAMPVFFNGEVLKVGAFLRYRIDEARLMFKVDLHRSSYILSEAFDGVVADITNITGVEPYHGDL